MNLTILEVILCFCSLKLLILHFNLCLSHVARQFLVVGEKVATVVHQVLDILPDIDHGIMKVVVHGERGGVPAFFEFELLGAGNAFLEIRTVLIYEVFVAESDTVESASRAEIAYGLRFCERVSVLGQIDCIYFEMSLVVDVRRVFSLVLRPEFGAQPVGKEGYEMVCSDRP